MTASAPTPTQLQDVDLSLAVVSKDDYEAELKTLQSMLTELAIACYHNGQRVVVVVEGWDAAGKGGSIRRMVEKLDPRSFRVYPIGAPSDSEAGEHYLQRFWRRLPGRGQLAIFDRSWYGRVLVERVEGLAASGAWQRAYGEINNFEKQLADDGFVVIKLFLHISQQEQLRRYEARLNDPRKHWKMTADDLRNRQRASDYRQAYDEMFLRTSTAWAPWHLVAAEHKWFARLECLRIVVDCLTRQSVGAIPQLTAEEIAETRCLLGLPPDGGS